MRACVRAWVEVRCRISSDVERSRRHGAVVASTRATHASQVLPVSMRAQAVVVLRGGRFIRPDSYTLTCKMGVACSS